MPRVLALIVGHDESMIFGWILRLEKALKILSKSLPKAKITNSSRASIN